MDTSTRFKRSITYPHAEDARITFFRGSTPVLVPGYEQYGLPILSGTVTDDIDSNTRRSVNLVIGDPKLSPQYVTDLLSGFGSEFFLEKGLVYPDRTTEWVPLGMYHIDSTSAVESGKNGPSISAIDRGGYIADYRMITPTQILSGSTIVSNLSRLCLEAIPPGSRNATFVDLLNTTRKASAAVWMERDRWKIINDLASAVNGILYFDELGRPTLDETIGISEVPDWTFTSDEVKGDLLEAQVKTSRDKTYNAMLVEATRSDGTAGFWALLVDGNPSSPTYWEGPFGKKPRFYSSPLFQTLEQAITYGRSQFDQIRMWDRTITLSTMNVFALKAGRTIDVHLPTGRHELHVMTKLSIPVGDNVGDEMQIETKSFSAPEESGA